LVNTVSGEYVLAKYSADGEWYRSKVTTTSLKQVRLRFIDFGNDADTPLCDVMAMPTGLAEYPAFAICCGLGVSTVAEQRKEVAEAFYDMFAKYRFVMAQYL
jgi:hypothetical protein